jgi:excisionase family DNA binding protein
MKPQVLEEDSFYTLRQVAEFLRVSYDTIARACRCGDLRAVKVRGQWRVSDSSLRSFLESAYAAASPALREPPQTATLRGRERQRRAPLRPRPTTLTKEAVST